MTSLRWLILALTMIWGAPPVQALESAAHRSPRAAVTLISDTDNFTPGAPFRIALRLRLAPGWHTYWRNPGDSGAAPELTPRLPPGFTASGIDWPTPGPLAEGPLMTYGYVGEVLFPLTITPAEAATARIEIEATWLVCKDVCVPEDGRFTLTLTRGLPGASAQAPLFAVHDAATPRPAPFAAVIDPAGRLRVTGEGLNHATVREARFIPGEPDQVRNETPQTLSVTTNTVTLDLTPARPGALANGISGVLSLRDAAGQRADLWLRAEPGAVGNNATPLGSATPGATCKTPVCGGGKLPFSR